MALIVTTTFDLDDGVAAEAFIEADGRYQTEVAYQQPGLLRRTTARGADATASWCVVEVWADAATVIEWNTGDLGAMVTNVDRQTYETLD